MCRQHPEDDRSPHQRWATSTEKQVMITDEELDQALGIISMSDDQGDEDENDASELLSLSEQRIDSLYSQADQLLADLYRALHTSFDSDDDSDSNTETDIDAYSSTLRRLKQRDPTLRTLEIYNPMEWDMDRWRRRNGDGSIRVDEFALAKSIVDLLYEAEQSLHITRLDWNTIRLDNPLLLTSIIRLLHSKNREWERISMDECEGITPELLQAIGTARVKTLHLWHNRLSSDLMMELGNLFVSSSSLTEIRFADLIRPRGMACFSKGLLRTTRLRNLDLTGCVCSEKGQVVKWLGLGLQGNESLRLLNLSRWDLPDENLEEVIASITQHRSLTWLDVSNNTCGPTSSAALSRLLEASQSLAGLTLTGCGIIDEVFVSILGALKRNSSIQHLHLGENAIADDGIRQLSAVLKECSSLRTLWLSENSFGTDGCESLLKAVQENLHLEQIIMDRHLPYFDQIQYWLTLNRAGRKMLKAKDTPLGIWPRILGKATAQADVFYFYLHTPNLLDAIKGDI